MRAPDGAHEFSAAFSEFWRQYPRQENQKAALAAFERALAKADTATLINGAMRYAADRDGEDPQYTKLPANWLDDERWTDGPKPKGNGASRHGKRQPTSMFEEAARAGGLILDGDYQ